MAFETYALYPNFTVEENLAFPLEVRGVGEDERRRKTQEISEILQITNILDSHPPELSGGQQQPGFAGAGADPGSVGVHS